MDAGSFTSHSERLENLPGCSKPSTSPVPASTKLENRSSSKKRLVMKSISEVLREEGIRIEKKPQSSSKDQHTPCKTKLRQRSSWFGYRPPEVPNIVMNSKPPLPVPEQRIVSLSAQEVHAQDPAHKLSGIARFRRIVNKVKNQIIWGRGFQRREKHLKTYLGPSHWGKREVLLTFNVDHFKPDTIACETLAMKAKAILVRPSWLRSEEDVKYLHRYMIRLNCLKKYPICVRKELSKCLLYEKFEKDRVVLRQGDMSYYFYFIITGSVLIEIEDEDEETGDVVKMIAGELKAGSSFGDVALLHQSKRGATFICHEDSEFLKVKKPDFDDLLKKNHEKELQHCLSQLRKHPLFKKWKETHLQKTVESSKIAEYTHGDVIVKDLSKPCETIFCIMQGSCLVVEKVNLWERVQRVEEGNLMLPVVPDATRKSTLGGKQFSIARANYKFFGSSLYQQTIKWWVIRVLREGDYFGLGEGRSDMSVVADQKIGILLVHKTMFREYDRGRGLGWLRTEAMLCFPSDEESLKSYLVRKQWNQYKRMVALEVLGEKPKRETKENYFLAQSSGAMSYIL